MKILAINASPHKEKGNTALILGPFLEGMKEAGADVEIFYTSDLTIKPCLGDHACQLKTPGKCIQDDDMKWLLPKIGQADILIFATPVYDDGVTGPMKMLMDRLIPGASYSIELRDGRLRHLLLDGGKAKKLVLVSNCGFPEMETFDPMLAHIKAYCANASTEFAGALLRPAGPAMANMLKNGAPVTDILEAAREAGRQLARDGRMSNEVLSRISRPIISQEGMMQAVGRLLQRKPGGQAEQKPAEAATSTDTGIKGKAPNKLAERMAMIRAGESRRPEGERVCYDPYAIRFVGPELGKLLALDPQQHDAAIARLEQGMPGLTNSVIARARFFDDIVKQAIADGLEQLVILGAGYDTRAYRIDGMDRVRVFEVDQPDTVAVKKIKVKEIFGSLPAHVTYVPIDFNAERLDSRLKECGYDPSKKTMFTLEGLIMYLDAKAVDELLAFIAHNSGMGSAVAFDYGRTHSEITSAGYRKESQATRKFTESQGDTLRFAMAGPVEAFLAERGFKNARNLTDDDYKKAYFTGKNAHRMVSGLLWFAYAVVE